jgi:putative cardiolipin synthase
MQPSRRLRFRPLLLLALALALPAGCASLPELEGRTASVAMTDTGDTRLGHAVQAEVSAHPGMSGIYSLARPLDAFVARAVLARGADRALDLQYYIWHADTTGYLLLEELWKAAGRGVRIRLLLDDNGTHGLDAALATLDAHPNIEVRLFNPFVNRKLRFLGYVTDFNRLNRRMHNKSFTADNHATIVGGRNVGDEYFGAGEGMVFADLDVVAFGRVVADVSDAFDQYWNSESAYPADLILGKAAPDGVEKLEAKFAAVRAAPEAVQYLQELERTRLAEQLRSDTLPLDWAVTRLVYDDPAKAAGKAERSELLWSRMTAAVGTPQRELDIISPYFVPGKRGTEALSAMAQQGIALRILTNSLAATDVGAVHAGYAKRRAPLLRGGVKLYELKPDAGAAPDAGATQVPAAKPKRDKKGPGGSSGGSSAASLHAKTFAQDRERVFVGSFNFDPRSVNLNTEMGVVIDSPKLADAVSSTLDRDLDLRAYEVRLAPDDRGLEWLERTPQGEVRYTSEPNTGFFKRFGVGFMSILPIEWML